MCHATDQEKCAHKRVGLDIKEIIIMKKIYVPKIHKSYNGLGPL
jgi:hypothetical protein